jgi:rhamnogalacturonyl hydrolase YesR
MHLYLCLALLLLGACRATSPNHLASSTQEPTTKTLDSLMREAMKRGDEIEIYRLVEQAKILLGANVGVPELADVYSPVSQAPALSKSEAQQAFVPVLERLPSVKWWRQGLDPTQTMHLPREVGSVITGCVAAVRGRLDGAEKALNEANEAGDYLLWTQAQAGNGVIPFPYYRDGQGRVFEVAERFLQRAEQRGLLNTIVRNGWVIDDLEDGGMQFDNGECGIALFELYELTRNAKYLAGATAVADWAVKRPLVTNWNYNSFSVYLLAKAFQVTGEQRYLDAAKHKARLGMYPGQLTEGAYKGRWFDPHNARPAYHYLMVRALVSLVSVMTTTDTERPKALQVLELALLARNPEFIQRGIMSKDKPMEALLLALTTLTKETSLLNRTQSFTAFQALSQTVSDEYRRGSRFPLSPGEWGTYLQYLVQQ